VISSGSCLQVAIACEDEGENAQCVVGYLLVILSFLSDSTHIVRNGQGRGYRKRKENAQWVVGYLLVILSFLSDSTHIVRNGQGRGYRKRKENAQWVVGYLLVILSFLSDSTHIVRNGQGRGYRKRLPSGMVRRDQQSDALMNHLGILSL
jgi:alkylated DNA repair dioxygenase AlkB